MQQTVIFGLIERIGSLVRAEERKKCASLGLLVVHLQVLKYLSSCNRYSNTPAAVASYLGMTRGTVSQSILLLENKGLIKKCRDLQDKRIARLELLPAGRQAIQQTELTEWFERASNHLLHGGRPDYEEVITKVLSALQKANQSNSFGLCKTCRHFNGVESGFLCRLTKEKLSSDDSEKICQEHLAT